jgi:hypothetical protein
VHDFPESLHLANAVAIEINDVKVGDGVYLGTTENCKEWEVSIGFFNAVLLVLTRVYTSRSKGYAFHGTEFQSALQLARIRTSQIALTRLLRAASLSNFRTREQRV